MTKQELQGRMRICFESSYLLYTTKNFETLTNRFQLLNLHLSELAKYDSVEGYIETFTLAKQQYERDYADKGEMPEYQIAAVYKPSEFNLSDFYVTCICGCASRFGKEKVAEMNSMQKQTAKKKRVEAILAGLDIAKKELENNCQNSAKFNVAIDAIHNMTRETMVLKIVDSIN